MRSSNGKALWGQALVWSFCLCSVVSAQRVQAPHGIGGTWNVYELVSEPVTWNVATDRAGQSAIASVFGRLADIASPAENAMLEYFGADLTPWIGLTDREGAAPDRLQWGVLSPQESSGSSEPQYQGWAWTSGHPFSYQNWVPGEPRDFRSREDAVLMRADGRWDDRRSGFAVDLPVPAARQPGTSLDESSPSKAAYFVEYSLGATGPVEGIPILEVPARMPKSLPGVRGDWGTLGVTDFLSKDPIPTQVQRVASWLTRVNAGQVEVTSYSAQVPRANLSNLSGNAQGGPAVSDPPTNFPSSSPAVDVVNRVSVAQATIHVPLAGRYTFNVHSSDGFALQIDGAPFLAASGEGMIDGVDPTVLYFPNQTGDSATRGVVNLSAGRHSVKFFTWSQQSDAFWEISTALGEHRIRDDAQWLALGDDRVLLSRVINAPVRLQGPAEVLNVSESQGGRVSNIVDAAVAVNLAREVGVGVSRNDLSTLVLRDADGICCGRPGASLDPLQTSVFPIDQAQGNEPSVAHDYFSTGVRGHLLVDDGDSVPGESHQITIGMYSSDGAQLHIHNASFLSASGLADLRYVVDGDTLLTSIDNESNVAAEATIVLTEGKNYSFDAYHFDDRMDAGLELWAAWGEHLGAFDPQLFVPISSRQHSLVNAENVGLTFVSPTAPLLKGDYNGDLQRDSRDLDLQAIGFARSDLAVDTNGDGRLDLEDRRLWVHTVARTYVGDANLDGLFNSADFVQVFIAGGFERDIVVGWKEGDFDGDGRFGTSDLVFAFQDGGYELPPGIEADRPQVESIPEPSSGVYLATLAMAFLCGHHRLGSVRAISSPPRAG